MSEVGVFTLEELGAPGTLGGAGQLGGAFGEKFTWTSDRNPPPGSRGGARACPLQPWTMPGSMRTVRTDYPGAKVPSEQVLGPRYGDQTLNGRFDDRFNFAGYAEQEKERLELVCRRGNLVRISFQGQTFEGILREWSFDYLRNWQIRYTFTMSVHERTNEVDISDRSPNTSTSAARIFDEINDTVMAMFQRDAALRRRNNLESALDTQGLEGTSSALDAMETALDRLGETLDAREILVNEEGALSVSPFTRLATQMRTVGGSASNAIESLIAARADVEIGVRNAMNVLNFEDWSRSIRFQSRILLGTTNEGASDMDERAAPNATRIYRPQEGESLYQISARFYGTPHSWRLIADRNNLSEFVLVGDETLIIPERGVG